MLQQILVIAIILITLGLSLRSIYRKARKVREGDPCGGCTTASCGGCSLAELKEQIATRQAHKLD